MQFSPNSAVASPDPAVRRNVAGTVDQPCVDLGKVVVDGLSDCQHGVFVRGRVEESHLHFVVRLVRFDPKVVGFSGLQPPDNKCAEAAVLLVRPLVYRTTLLVRVHRHRPRNDGGGRMDVRYGVEVREIVAVGQGALRELFGSRRSLLIEADPGTDHRLDDLQVRADENGPATPVLDPEPIVGQAAEPGVVVVLDVVRATNDVQDLLAVSIRESQVGCLLGRVVGLSLQHQIAPSERIDGTQRDADVDDSDLWSPRRQRRCQRRETGIVRDPTQRLLLILDCPETQRVSAGSRRTIHDVRVGVDRVEGLGPARCCLHREVTAITLVIDLTKARALPRQFDASVGRQRRGSLDAYAQLQGVPLEKGPSTVPVPIEGNRFFEGGDGSRCERIGNQQGQTAQQPNRERPCAVGKLPFVGHSQLRP